jgi:hypothetical protein
MSIEKDLKFWTLNELEVKKYLESIWYNVKVTDLTNIHDFIITKNKIKVNVELKTRRCDKDKYPDTLIGANKLWLAWDLFYKNWEETIFFFKFTDWLYYINPLDYLPKREYKLQRWGRGIDKEKWWIYYQVKNLIKVY